MKLQLASQLVLIAATLGIAVPRAEAQVVFGGTGFAVGPGFTAGVISPFGYGGGYGYGYGGGPYGPYYPGTYYNGPIVGYGPAGYGYGFDYPPYYIGNLGPYVLPPVVIPAETMFGPGVVQNFLGADSAINAPAALNLPAAGGFGGAQGNGGFGVNAPGVQVPKARIPASNDASRERSKRHLEIGDEWFRKQEYGNAATAYRDAIRAAPDVADAYFHQAAVATAQGRYEAAVDSIKSGLRVTTAYVDGEFKYTTLYGVNKAARIAHLEALAQKATVEPSADLYFLMGVLLFFDEQPRRSGPFFTKAKELAVGETWHIDVFSELLRRMDADAAEAAMAKGKPANGVPPAAHPPQADAPKAAAPREAADGREI